MAEALPRETDDNDNDPDAACHLGLVHGLVSRKDLNGRLARAVRWVPTKGRWALIMDGGEKVRVGLPLDTSMRVCVSSSLALTRPLPNTQVLVRDENIDFQATEAIEAMDLPSAVGEAVGGPVLGTEVTAEAKHVMTKPTADPTAAAYAYAAVAASEAAVALGSEPPVVAWMQNMARCFCLPIGEKPQALPMPAPPTSAPAA